MKIKWFLLSAILICTFPSVFYGQEIEFERAEEFSALKMDRAVGNVSVDAKWSKSQDKFWYSFRTPEERGWFLVDVRAGGKKMLFDRKRLSNALYGFLHKPFDHANLDLKEVDYDFSAEVLKFKLDTFFFKYSINQDLLSIDSSKQGKDLRWINYSPDSSWIVFAKNFNLFLMRAGDRDSVEHQLTFDGELWYNYQFDEGDTTTNKRLRSGAHWFKNSNMLWINKQDLRKVKPLWVIKSLSDPRPTLMTYKYAMPGENDIPRDEIWVFNSNSETKKGVKLKLDDSGDPDYTIGGVYFNENGVFNGNSDENLYLLRRNREWNKIEVLKSNTTTGNTQKLFGEDAFPYFNTRFAQLEVLNNDKNFIWWSERDGDGQLYFYNENGDVVNKITSGTFRVGRVLKIDTIARYIYFEGYNQEEDSLLNPYYIHLYKVKFDGTGLKKITKDEANHNITASLQGNYFVDNYSQIDQPTRSVLIDGDGKVLLNLESVDITPLVAQGWAPPTRIKVKATDGITDLYGVMWLPFDFDSTKKYPIISYVYPGPQTEPFPVSFQLNDQTGLAQLGFVVVAVGQRGGSPMRSRYYHTFGYGNMRDYPLEDNKFALEQLSSRYKFIDITRVGIWGHSGGGFMSSAAILTYPEFYKVAWSESGNHDNNIYNIWWSEVHNGVKPVKDSLIVKSKLTGAKDEAGKKWEAGVRTNAELAYRLKGNLMLVTGTADNNVHPSNTYRLANALIEANKRFDFLIMPDRAHRYDEFPYIRVRRWQYFAEHLLNWNKNGSGVDLNISKVKDPIDVDSRSQYQ